jgi:protein N-terminal methyltransferase
LETIDKHWSNGQKPDEDFVASSNEPLRKNDEKSSRNLIKILNSDLKILKTCSVLELAAGMGRVTKKVLLQKFERIDVLEPDEKLAAEIEKINTKKIKNIYVKKGQDFEFKDSYYDVIWGQWFLENMSDVDNLKFLIKARDHLNDGGKIVLKENIYKEDIVQITFPEGQRIRPLKVYLLFFRLVGLRPVYIKLSDDYPVSSYTPLYEIVLEKDD